MNWKNESENNEACIQRLPTFMHSTPAPGPGREKEPQGRTRRTLPISSWSDEPSWDPSLTSCQVPDLSVPVTPGSWTPNTTYKPSLPGDELPTSPSRTLLRAPGCYLNSNFPGRPSKLHKGPPVTQTDTKPSPIIPLHTEEQPCGLEAVLSWQGQGSNHSLTP